MGLRPVRPFKPGDFTILGYARRNLPLRKVAGRTQKAYVSISSIGFHTIRQSIRCNYIISPSVAQNCPNIWILKWVSFSRNVKLSVLLLYSRTSFFSIWYSTMLLHLSLKIERNILSLEDIDVLISLHILLISTRLNNSDLQLKAKVRTIGFRKRKLIRWRKALPNVDNQID